jgi:adenylate kinase
MAPTNDRAAWLKAGTTTCSCEPSSSTKAYRLVLLGAPGVGKGTQAELLAKGLGTCPLSTGDVFRDARNQPDESLSPAMKGAVELMRKGELVPDSTVLNMIQERVRCLRCPGGFLLDGFPRTVPQAEALEGLLEREQAPLYAVISYDLPIDTIVNRLAGRRTCKACKAVYHTETRPTTVPGVCNSCGGPVIQRDDDKPEAIRVRMEAYERSTTPLINFYRERNLLIQVPADGSPDEIYQRSQRALEKMNPKNRHKAGAGQMA